MVALFIFRLNNAGVSASKCEVNSLFDQKYISATRAFNGIAQVFIEFEGVAHTIPAAVVLAHRLYKFMH